MRTKWTAKIEVFSRDKEVVPQALFSSHPINPVNAKKKSHRMFRHMHGVLNEVYLQNFLYEWDVNRETNLMSLLNP